MEKTQLEVGDKITKYQYSSIRGFTTVTRVTAKRAFCLSDNKNYEIQLDREVTNGRIREIGGDTYSPSYSLTTQADLDSVALKDAREALKARFNETISKLPLSQCEAIMAILNPA